MKKVFDRYEFLSWCVDRYGLGKGEGHYWWDLNDYEKENEIENLSAFELMCLLGEYLAETDDETI